MSEPLFTPDAREELRRAVLQRKRELSEDKDSPLSGKRILFAEDDMMAAHLMMRVLSAKGIKAERAKNGKLAVEIFESSADGFYDAVIMDIHMPIMDGLEAAKAIRELGRADSPEVPIIAMTASDMSEDAQRSIDAGMTMHLTKPVDPELLYRTLEKLLVQQ